MLLDVVRQALPRLAHGTVVLLGIQLAVAVASWAVLKLTLGRPYPRLAALFALAVAYHLTAWVAIDGTTAMSMALVFVWLHVGFVFRFLSCIYWHRSAAGAPSLLFHVLLLLWGPRQRYGASDWADLKSEPFRGKWARQWGWHLAYSATVVVLALGLMWLAIELRVLPLEVRRGMLRGAWFVLGLEALTFCANLQAISWWLFGYHSDSEFFGRFAWFRSKHIGQFWNNWNTAAIRAFRELVAALRLRRHYFWSVMAVFFASGLVHQALVIYMIRKPAYGTMLSFMLHGALVYSFGVLYHRRHLFPAPLRLALFNPMTSAVVTILASQPFVMDFYGQFVLSF